MILGLGLLYLLKKQLAMNKVDDLISEIKQIREEYNKNSGWFYGFNDRFDEVVKEINAILNYLKRSDEE